MKKDCSTCRYTFADGNEEPCNHCSLYFLPNGNASRTNWQPARSTRKELEAQLAALRQECEQYKAEREVAIENEELAKQQRDELIIKVAELEKSAAYKKEIIEKQRRELSTLSIDNFEFVREINKMQRKLNIKDGALMVRDAIIKELREECDEARRERDELHKKVQDMTSERDEAVSITPEMLTLGKFVEVAGYVERITEDASGTKYYIEFLHRNYSPNGASFELDDILRVSE